MGHRPKITFEINEIDELSIRQCFEKFKVKCTVSRHLLQHAGNRLVIFERKAEFGFGIFNCSAHESAHQEVAKQLGSMISHDHESIGHRLWPIKLN